MPFLTKYPLNHNAEEESRLGCAVDTVEDRAARFPAKTEYVRNHSYLKIMIAEVVKAGGVVCR